MQKIPNFCFDNWHVDELIANWDDSACNLTNFSDMTFDACIKVQLIPGPKEHSYKA